MEGVRSNLGWKSSWWMVLWAGAILHCSFHVAKVTSTIVPVEATPPNPMETGEVLFSTPIPTNRILFCTWFRQLTEDDVVEIMTAFPTQGSENQPGPAYTGRETIYRNCSLHIKELRLNDSGTYLISEGGAGFANAGNVTLNVVEIVPTPNVIITPAPFLMESQSVQLRCNTPITHEVIWFKDKKPLDDGYDFTDANRTLSIASITRRDTGEYKCQVSNGITTIASEPAYLSVIYGPEDPVIHPNKACNKEDQNIILTCQAASCPEPQYTWFRDDVQLYNGPKLFIQNLNESQAGVYVCEAMNELLYQRARSDGQHIRLEKSCVSDVTITGSLEGTEDFPTSLNCTAGGDDVKYSWMKRNQTVLGNGRVSLTNNGQTLNFSPCHRNDAADYKCHASNSFSSSESVPFGLSIIYGPDPPFINETIDINQEKISLTCVAVAYPATENQWFHNGMPILENPNVLTMDIDPDKSGNYTCRAKNPRSGVTRETTLEIDMIGRLQTLRRR